LLALDFVTHIDLREPALRLVGHAFHQSCAVRAALELVPEGATVLRLRPDLFAPGIGVENKLKRGLADCSPPVGFPSIFEKKVGIIAAALVDPFYINDIVLVATKRDMEEIFHFDYGQELRFGSLSPEQLFYSRLFIRAFPIFEQYFRYN